ncbi:hypothetical protein [Reichenbachiella versicolor]|uniref:hypothetical protein n=1 Tax=Reichenbachiella versicolor TaxID=1821036 RepID=UPI0013A5B1F4|nr:hypothetical protein [Reichenbachiella versicolor]
MNKHILILIGLIVVSVGLFFYDGSNSSSVSFDVDMFQIEDTSSLKSLIIERFGKKIEIQNPDGWLLNERYAVDPSLIKVTKAIMSQVSIIRPVSRLNFDEIKTDLLTKGAKVTLGTKTGVKSFYAGGNATKSVGYFANENLTDIYVVGIPGYENYLSGIFELTLNQWRDRMLFASNWRSIQNLRIKYSNAENLDIYFDKKFLAVNSVNLLDTAVFMDYLSQYEQFMLNDYLDEGEFPRYDSLSKVEPFATLTLDDIDASRSRNLKIYPLIPKERFYLLKDDSDQMIVVDKGRMEKLMKKGSYFSVNK